MGRQARRLASLIRLILEFQLQGAIIDPQLLNRPRVLIRVKPVPLMNRNPPSPDDSWESDAVWKLLDQAPPRIAGSRFADDTVRAARLSREAKPWWSRLLSPAPLTGLAAAAALALAMIPLTGQRSPSSGQAAMPDSPQAVAIQDIAETETLIAAADQLDDFSDNELVSLIGF
jgi:hypothetical protein